MRIANKSLQPADLHILVVLVYHPADNQLVSTAHLGVPVHPDEPVQLRNKTHQDAAHSAHGELESESGRAEHEPHEQLQQPQVYDNEIALDAHPRDHRVRAEPASAATATTKALDRAQHAHDAAIDCQQRVRSASHVSQYSTSLQYRVHRVWQWCRQQL